MIQKSKIQMAKGLCLFAGVALGAAVLTGCSSEDISSRAQGDGHPKVQVTATVLSADPQTATRADDGLNIASTGFSDNTKTVYIGVNKGSAGASEWTGYEFGISGTGNSQTLTAPVSNGPEFPSGVTSVSVYGWYPYNNGSKTFSVLADQSTNANYNASDLMLANSATCSHDGSSVTAADLTFRHALTKMKVTVTPGANVTINSIKLKSMKPQVTIDDTDKAALTVGSADGTPMDITLFSGSSTAAVTQCAVFPGQEKAAGALLVVNASANGGSATDVTYSLDGAKTFTADKQYVMNIALNATAVAAGSVTLTDWATASGTVTVNAGGGGLELQTSSSGSNGYVTFDAIADQLYSGSALTPTPRVRVRINGTQVTLVNGTDFDFSYENNVNAGTATVKVTGKTYLSGTVSTTFNINDCQGADISTAAVGKIICSHGKVHDATTAENLPKCSGKRAAVVAYMNGGTNWAISIKNAPNDSWFNITSDGTTAGANKDTNCVVDGAKLGDLPAAPAGMTWYVLTMDNYKTLWNSFGGADRYNETSNGYITAAGGTACSGFYWSTTGYNAGNAWQFYSDGWTGYHNDPNNKYISYGVRPVLAF